MFLPDPGAENIEGGVKFSLWERKLNVTVAYYELSQDGAHKVRFIIPDTHYCRT